MVYPGRNKQGNFDFDKNFAGKISDAFDVWP